MFVPIVRRGTSMAANEVAPMNAMGVAPDRPQGSGGLARSTAGPERSGHATCSGLRYSSFGGLDLPVDRSHPWHRQRTRSRLARQGWFGACFGLERNLCLAGAPGFEPGNVGTKNRCLTTWRRPNSRQSRSCGALLAEQPKSTILMSEAKLSANSALLDHAGTTIRSRPPAHCRPDRRSGSACRLETRRSA